jgi:sialic acid synthase SpsE
MTRDEGSSAGGERAPCIIAEMSGNHSQSLDRALAIVDAAAEAGAHAIELQTLIRKAASTGKPRIISTGKRAGSSQ